MSTPEPEATRPERESMRTAISNEIVSVYAKYAGRGPNRTRTHLGPGYALVVLEDLFTVAERTLIRAGRESTVRESRILFQDATSHEFIGAVERVTGRKVKAFLSQRIPEPEIAVEIFLFDDEDRSDGAGSPEQAERGPSDG